MGGDKLCVFADYGILNQPLFVMGYLINLLLWMQCLFLNFEVLFVAENPLDFVLKVIALYFIAEIDNMLVPSDAYAQMLEWFEDKDNVSRMELKAMSTIRYRMYV